MLTCLVDFQSNLQTYTKLPASIYLTLAPSVVFSTLATTYAAGGLDL